MTSSELMKSLSESVAILERLMVYCEPADSTMTHPFRPSHSSLTSSADVPMSGDSPDTVSED
jgi:hypothetical protein